MNQLSVAISRLGHATDLPLPNYASLQAAGMDLLAAIPTSEILRPGESRLIPIGIAIALPDGFEAQVRPRSGLAMKYGVTVLNSPGTIDADYRGEIRVILVNLGQKDFIVKRGMRIAQLIVAPVTSVKWQEVKSLPSSHRSSRGFGSTGFNRRI